MTTVSLLECVPVLEMAEKMYTIMINEPPPSTPGLYINLSCRTLCILV